METAAELEIRLSQIGVSATLDSVAIFASKRNLDDCSDLGTHQDKTLATKAPRLAKEDGEFNLNYPVQWIDRLVRGLQTWPGTFAQVQITDGKMIRLIVPSVIPFECNLAENRPSAGTLLYGSSLKEFLGDKPELQLEIEMKAPGTKMLAVATNGVLAIPHVQPAGKRLMAAEEFLRGNSRCDFMKIIGEPGSHRLLNLMSCS